MKKKKANDSKATLQANLASLISNLDEDYLFDHVNLGMCMHNGEFMDDDDDRTVLENVNLPALIEWTDYDSMSSVDDDDDYRNNKEDNNDAIIDDYDCNDGTMLDTKTRM